MFSSLKSKMIIPIISLMALMVVFIVVYVSVGTANLVRNFNAERMSAATQSLRSYLHSREQQTFMFASLIGGSAELIRHIENQNTEGVWQYIFDRKTLLGIDSVIITDHEGIVLARSHARAAYGDDGSVVPSIGAALRGETVMLYTPTPTIPMTIASAAPIFDGNRIVGSVSTTFNIGNNEFIDNLQTIFEVDITTFNREGISVSSTLIHPETGNRDVGTAAAPHIIEAVLGRGEHLSVELNVFGLLPYYAYYFPLPGMDGSPNGMLFVGISQEFARETISALQMHLIFISAGGLVALIIVMFLFITHMLKPISLLTKTIDNASNGDLTKRLPESGRDEIAKASRSFNKTMEELRIMITAIKEQAGTLSGIGTDLASNMTETASAMNEIAANIHSIKGRVVNQSASVTQTNATMGQVTSNINRLSGQVENQSGAVNQAASSLEEMLANIKSVTATLAKNAANVKELQESSEIGRSSLQEVASDIQEIARESEGLLEINAVIENIASQTNLLSMNAAIEAAHAGESGRGFAVVADEIRKLAENSSEQSKIIGDVLKKIKDSIDKITRSTDKVIDRFEVIDQGVKTVAEQEEHIRSAMKEQGEGGQQVLRAAGSVGDITQQVRSSAKEMMEGSKEVIQESKNLELATQEITNGMNEMAVGTEQVNNAVNSANALTSKTRDNISSLVRAVSRFKV